MRESGLRLTIGDDAHAPAHLGAYREPLRGAKQAGYRVSGTVDGNRVWNEIGVGEAGIRVRVGGRKTGVS